MTQVVQVSGYNQENLFGIKFFKGVVQGLKKQPRLKFKISNMIKILCKSILKKSIKKKIFYRNEYKNQKTYYI